MMTKANLVVCFAPPAIAENVWDTKIAFLLDLQQMN